MDAPAISVRQLTKTTGRVSWRGPTVRAVDLEVARGEGKCW